MARPTTADRVARVLLKVQLDRQELTNTQKQLDAFNKTLNDLEREKGLAKLAQDSARAVAGGKSLRSELGRLKAELLKVGATEDEIARVVRQFDRLRESAERASAATRKSTGNTALRALGTDIRNLPALPIPGTPISTDVVGKILASIGRTQVTFDQLAVGLGLLATVGTSVVLVIKAFVDSLQATKQRVLDEIATRQKLNELLVTGTRDVLNAELETLRVRRKIAELNLADIAPRFAEEFDKLASQGPLALGADAVFGLLGLNDPKLQANKETAIAALKALTDLDREIGIYVQALGSAEVATNSAADAEKKLAAEREKIADARVSAQIAAELQVRKQDAATIRERIAAINEEMALNLRYSQSADISSEKVAQLTQRTRDLAVELDVLTNALPEKERIEQAAETFKKIKDGVNDLIKETAKNFKDLQKVTQEIGELKSDFKERVTEIQNRLSDALIEAARDRDIALSEAQRDADMARTEAVREAGLERAEIERDSQLAIQRILRRSKLDINNAIQNRDAVALDAARARRDEELAAEEQNRAERLRKLDIELREQLRTIDIRLKEQNRTIAMRYDEQVRRAALAAQKSIEIETAKFNKELALKAQEAADILGIEQQKVNTTVTKAQETLTVASNFWNNMVSLANRALTASNAAKVVRPTPGNPNIQVRPGQRIPTMDTGGRILSDGLIYAHAGEQIVNPKRGQRAGGGDIVFAPQINGMNKTQIRRELTRQLDRFVEENF